MAYLYEFFKNVYHKIQLYLFTLHDSAFQEKFKLIFLLDILDIHRRGKQITKQMTQFSLSCQIRSRLGSRTSNPPNKKECHQTILPNYSSMGLGAYKFSKC